MPKLQRLAALILSKRGLELPDKLKAALLVYGNVVVPPVVLDMFETMVAVDPTASLAYLYSRVVAAENRRFLGTFFTPREYAESMVEHYANQYDDPKVVVDVGAGVGIFSELAARYWKTAEVFSVDVNPFTLGLQAVAMSQRCRLKTRLVLGDYRDWLKQNCKAGPTLYLGNPPYTRWQLIPKQNRQQLVADALGLVGPLANLSTLFFGMSLVKLTQDDGLVMILPSNWMHARYARELRAWLRKQVNRKIVLRRADSWRFDDAMVDAVSVEVGPQCRGLQQMAISSWKMDRCFAVQRQDGEKAIRFAESGDSPDTSSRSEVLLEQYARIVRGTATGANRFFIRAPEQWRDFEIDEAYRTPLARRLRAIEGREESVPDIAELLCLEMYKRGENKNVDLLIAMGERDGVDRGYLCSSRPKWYDLSKEFRRPDVIISTFARERFHVMVNVDKLAISNNLFGLYWKEGICESLKESILCWLRSCDGQDALRRCSSEEGCGLLRLSPRRVGLIKINRAVCCGTVGSSSKECS